LKLLAMFVTQKDVYRVGRFKGIVR